MTERAGPGAGRGDAPFRQLRIFVSSTFNDMRAERNVLLEKVFPMVAAYCHRRKVEFVGVDLRWGVSEEQSRRGETVAVCMAEIDRCRPLFMGMVGQRYGWVPEGKDVSVTEQEILYGALDAPGDTEAFFYLRAPELTQALCGPYEPDPRIDDLKRRIRESGFPCMDGYRDLDAFGRRAYEDLVAAVDRLTDRAEEAGPVETLRNDQLFLARRYAATFVERPEETARLEALARQGGLILLTGEPGCGKTALLSKWALENAEGQDAYTFLYFIGGAADKGWERLARQLIGELCRRFEIGQPACESPEDVRRAVFQVLHMAAGKGRVLLALDQMDALALDDGFGLSWLPEELPEGVCAVAALDEGEALNRLRRRPHREMALERLTPEAVGRVAESYLGAHSKTLSLRHLGMLRASEQARNPLYLITLLNEVRHVGRHNMLTEQFEGYLGCRDIQALFDRVLERLDRDYDEDGLALPRRMLTLMEASRGGLTEGEMIPLLGNIPTARFAPLSLALEAFTAVSGGATHISVPAFRQAVRRHYAIDADAVAESRAELIAWFRAHPDTPRRNYVLPWLLRETEDRDGLAAMISRPDCFQEIWRRNKNELKAYWTASERDPAEGYREVLAAPETCEAAVRLDLAAFFLETGRGAEADGLLESILSAPGGASPYLLCQAYGLQGNLRQQEGRLADAESAYRRKAALAEEMGDRYEQQRALGNIGLVALMRGNAGEARRAFEGVLGLAEELNQRDGQQIALGNLGNIAFSLGERAKAKALYERQKTISIDSGSAAGIIHACGALGVILMGEGSLDAAEKEFAEQERQSRRIGAADGLGNALGNRAVLAHRRGDRAGAEALFRQKLKLCRETGQTLGEQNALGNLAALAAEQGNWETALAWAEERLARAREIRAPRQHAEALCQVSDAEAALGRDAEARRHRLQAETIARQHGFAIPPARRKE